MFLYYVLIFPLNHEQKLQRGVIMLCQEKKQNKKKPQPTNPMVFNGTKNMAKVTACSDELRMVFMSTCKVFSGCQGASGFSQFLLSLFYSPPTFCIYIHIYMFCLCPEGPGQDNSTLPCCLGATEQSWFRNLLRSILNKDLLQ